MTVEQQSEFFPESPPRWQGHILTSILERWDIAVELVIRDFFFEGTGDPIVLNIENGAIDFSRSGGYLDHLVPSLDAVKHEVASGVVVPDAVPAWQPPTLVEFLVP